MHEFWYDYVKPKYGEKAKFHYMDTYSFMVFIKAEDIQADIVKDVEAKFYTLNYELDRALVKGKNKKSNWNNEIDIRW